MAYRLRHVTERPLENGSTSQYLKNADEMAPKTKRSPEPITIHGLVVPAEWDDNGRPKALSIATFDEEEYVVDKEAGDRLLDALGKEVLMRGILQKIGKKKFLRHCSILKIRSTPLQSSG